MTSSILILALSGATLFGAIMGRMFKEHMRTIMGTELPEQLDTLCPLTSTEVEGMFHVA